MMTHDPYRRIFKVADSEAENFFDWLHKHNVKFFQVPVGPSVLVYPIACETIDPKLLTYIILKWD